jgi:hypothetical protein
MRNSKGQFVKGHKTCGMGSFKHGLKGSRFYRIYTNINTRCYNKKVSAYPRYGGRGIICLWENFNNFKDDMYDSYLSHVETFGEKNTQIDRIDGGGNYCKDNCRWATIVEQSRNMSSNMVVIFKGEKHCIREWEEKVGLPMNCLWQRLYRLHWSIAKALTTPLQ